VRTITLTDYLPSEPIRLSITQRDTLRQLVRDLTVSPVPGSDDTYTLTGSSTVGVARVGDLTVELRPKIGVAPVLFLVSYALDPSAWKVEHASLSRDANLAEAVVPLFVRTAHQAMRPGLLHGYRRCNDTLATIRGRVRIAEQFRTRTGLTLPIEVAYDDFTPDILENRLLRTAVDMLGQLHLRHRDSRTTLARLRRQLNGISSIVADRRGIPEPHWTRFNERYRAAVALARLIINTAGLEARAGGKDASAFLVDMNALFERFIRVAVREALGIELKAFPPAARGHVMHLDQEHKVPLKPDLSWWSGGRCLFAGDCKYKRTEGTVPNADVYQMLAYLTALELTNGLLIYAAGEDIPHTVTVAAAGKRIYVRTVDVTQAPMEVLSQVRALARLIRLLAISTSQTVTQDIGLASLKT
jgi:5-methylcytosine-specific restriction enzyme subunit McrC